MKTLFALIASLAVNAALFGFLPAMGYWRHHAGDGKIAPIEAKLVSSPVIPKKKEKPRDREERQTQQKKAPEPGKSVGRQRFVMDLGPGGGGGAGANAAAISQGDLQQASYAEGETDVDARPISQSAPQRPKKAVAAGAGGMVRCLLTVDENGRVAHVQFLEVPPGDYGFQEAVRAAVSSWRFQPAMVGGVPVRQRIEQPFRF